MTITVRQITATATAAILFAACGSSGGSDAENEPAPETTTATAEPEAEPEADADAEVEVEVEPDAEPEADAEVEVEPDAEPEAEPDPVVFEMSELPALVEAAADATDPAATAELVIGLPLAIGVDGATAIVDLSARIDRVDDDGTDVLRHDLRYSAAAPIADVDINLDDNGPGSVEIIELYDASMTELGYRRTGSTGSDPGDEGGPNSVNHVYSPEFEVLVASGLNATPRNVFIWNDENLLGIANPTDDELVPGRTIDVEFDTMATADDGIDALAVPVLAAIARATPVPDGATVNGARLDLRPRPADAFDADLGSYYFDVVVRFDVPGGATYGELTAFYADPANLGAASGDVLGAEPSFFTDGEWEATEGSEFADLDWRRGVLLLERYDGEVRVQGTDDGVEIEFRFRLDELAPALTAPAE